jgi:hypothetical protein
MVTFGVGPSASRQNVGPNVNMNSKMALSGKVYDRGVKVFDPAVNKVEQIQDDTFLNSKPNAVSVVTITAPSSKTRAVYVSQKAGMSSSTLAWIDDVITNSRTITGSVKLGSAAAIASDSVTLTQDGTSVTATFNQPSDMGVQSVFNTQGSIGKITEADGETINFTVAPGA